MVEKIIINPNEVRGFGDIVSPKTANDFELYNSTLSVEEDTVYGSTMNVFLLESDSTHSYSLSFGSASYTATGGACTVSVTLTDNSSPVENATISVSGGTGGSGTGTTNSSGVASINVTGVTASGTLTASFSGVTATASVTVQSYLFRDGGVTGDVNTDYTDVGGTINTSVSATGTNISCSSYSNCARIPNVQLSGDFEITYTLVARSGDGGGFFILNNNTTTNNAIGYIDSNANNGWNINYNGDQWRTVSASLPYDVKITRIGSTFTIYVNDTQINQRDVTSNDIYMGWKTHSAGGRNFTFKDFTIEAI